MAIFSSGNCFNIVNEVFSNELSSFNENDFYISAQGTLKNFCSGHFLTEQNKDNVINATNAVITPAIKILFFFILILL